jgi:hypothetical protein
MSGVAGNPSNKVNLEAKFSLKRTMKAQRGIRGIDLFFL